MKTSLMHEQRKKFYGYVIPSIGSMLITSLYVVVDGIFVGQGISLDALAAINLAGPYIMIVVAIAMMITIGGATVSAISLGQGNSSKASQYFTISLKLLILFSAIVTLTSVPFPTQISKILGANDALLNDTACYLRYFILFSFFFCCSMALSAFVRNDGAPKLAFWGMVAGGLSNIFLDWLFIFPLKMGIMGPAIASGLGQIFSCLILLSHFLHKKGQLHWTPSPMNPAIILEIFKRGTPEFMNQLFQPITVLCYNLIAIRIYGEIGVAAFSVVYYILTITVSIFIGVTQGIQPLISLSYGEKNKENIKFYYHQGIFLNTILSIIVYFIMFLFGQSIIRIFNSDISLMKIGYSCIKIYGLSFLFTAINMVIISYLSATKQTKQAFLLSTVRCLFLIPFFVFLAPMIGGKNAIWTGISFAEISFLIIALIFSHKKKNL